MNKKGIMKGIVLVMILAFSLNFVSAASMGSDLVDMVRSAGDVVVEILDPIFKEIIGPSEGSDIFLAKIIFFFIILFVVWSAINRIDLLNEYAAVTWALAIGVSIIAIRWIGNKDVIETIILPYSVLGVAITAIFPFLIWFMIVKDWNKTPRKIAWVLYMVVFIWLATSRPEIGNAAYIYVVTALVALLVLIFDGTIHNTFQKIKFERIKSSHDAQSVHRLQGELDDIRKRYLVDKVHYKGLNGIDGPKGYIKDEKVIQEMIAKLGN